MSVAGISASDSLPPSLFLARKVRRPTGPPSVPPRTPRRAERGRRISFSDQSLNHLLAGPSSISNPDSASAPSNVVAAATSHLKSKNIPTISFRTIFNRDRHGLNDRPATSSGHSTSLSSSTLSSSSLYERQSVILIVPSTTAVIDNECEYDQSAVDRADLGSNSGETVTVTIRRADSNRESDRSSTHMPAPEGDASPSGSSLDICDDGESEVEKLLISRDDDERLRIASVVFPKDSEMGEMVGMVLEELGVWEEGFGEGKLGMDVVVDMDAESGLEEEEEEEDEHEHEHEGESGTIRRHSISLPYQDMQSSAFSSSSSQSPSSPSSDPSSSSRLDSFFLSSSSSDLPSLSSSRSASPELSPPSLRTPPSEVLSLVTTAGRKEMSRKLRPLPAIPTGVSPFAPQSPYSYHQPLSSFNTTTTTTTTHIPDSPFAYSPPSPVTATTIASSAALFDLGPRVSSSDVPLVPQRRAASTPEPGSYTYSSTTVPGKCHGFMGMLNRRR